MTVRKWSQRSLDNLRGIHPDLRAVMDEALRTSPVDFIVTEGWRTKQRQRDMVAQRRSRTLNSRHLTGHAVDLWPIDPATGRAAVNNDPLLWRLYRQMAPAIKAAAEKLGISVTWGGDWTSIKDGPHWELSWHDYPPDAPWPAGPRAVLTAVEVPPPTVVAAWPATVLEIIRWIFGRQK